MKAWLSGAAVVLAVSMVVLGGMVVFAQVRQSAQVSPYISFDMLPEGAYPVVHDHSAPAIGDEHARAEMHHYATAEALSVGGPVYGVYGYQIVSIEYEVPAAEIGERPVGEEETGFVLNPETLGLPAGFDYDHFHIGRKEGGDSAHGSEDKYIVHFMLVPHAQETAWGLSCG